MHFKSHLFFAQIRQKTGVDRYSSNTGKRFRLKKIRSVKVFYIYLKNVVKQNAL